MKSSVLFIGGESHGEIRRIDEVFRYYKIPKKNCKPSMYSGLPSEPTFIEVELYKYLEIWRDGEFYRVIFALDSLSDQEVVKLYDEYES